MARHYDTVLISASKRPDIERPAGRTADARRDLLRSAWATRGTPISKHAIQSIRLAGGNPLGIVLWDDVEPAPIAPAEIAAGVRPQRTAEMEALVGSRAR